MTSTICGSGIYYTNEIFKVVRVDRLKQHTITYIFVGEQEREIKDALYNLESKGSLTSKEDTLLKNHFKNNYSIITKNKTNKIKIVFQRIYVDDTILTIRKKIFCFLSTQSDLLIEQNQELWVVIDGKVKILGPTWTNIIAEPSILQKEIKPDYKNFVSKNGQTILIETVINNNDQILYEATNGLKLENHQIFMHCMEDEMEYLKSTGKIADQILLDGYFQKYWPNALESYNRDVIYKDMDKLRKIMKAEDRLINFVENVPVEYDMFTGCRIIQVLLHITNDYEHEFIDLFKVFNLFVLDEKTPFKRYKDQDWPAPKFKFYRPLIKNQQISKKQAIDWVAATKKVKNATDQVIKEIQYSVRGLTFKRYIYTLEGEPKYATINIHKNGNIEVRIAFKEKQAASMKDVYEALVDIGKLINKINEIDYRPKQEDIPKSVKLNVPQVTFNESKNLMEFYGRTKLVMLDTITGINVLDDEYNYKQMNSFANKYFTPYLSPILSKKNFEKSEFLSKYKRVSFYSRMNLEYEFIHKTIQQNPTISKENIIILLHESYYIGKPMDEAIKTFQEWERKFGYMGSQGKSRQTGIELRIKNGKIHINGSKSVFQLTNASNFMAKFLNIFLNQAKILKKSQVKDIFTDELALIEDYETSFNDIVINNSQPINNSFNFGNTLGDLYANDEVLAANISSNENINEVKEENAEDWNREGYLAKDDEIDRNIRMQCDDRDEKRKVCTDFCEDDSYTLRRLQYYDKDVFKFKKDPKFDTYSRQCQQSKHRQPFVMRFNPADNPKIDKTSYKNAVQYGSSAERQNWYVCAQAVCPYEEIPINYNLVKDNLKARPTRKGVCLTAKCPSCLKEGRTTWLKIIPDDKFQPYVGFIDASYHPNNLCMPCCFLNPMDDPSKKGYTKFMKCLGKDVDSTNNKESTDYIMGREKMPLEKGRLGILPPNLANLFKTKCEPGKMVPGQKCYLRYGVKNDIQQSFLLAIAAAVEENEAVNLTVLKKLLFEERLTKRLFESLNQGELAIVFDIGKKKDPMQNFIDYMMSDKEFINEEWLWDFLSRPGVLSKEGVNIFILTYNSVLCPMGFNAKEFFNPAKKSIIIYNKEKYYEPIFYVYNEKGKINLKKKFLPDEPEVMKLYDMVVNNCVSKKIVDWEKVRKNTLGEKYYEIVPKLTANEVLQLYKERIVGQIKDKFNKAWAFITDFGFLLPFHPQGDIIDIEIIDKWTPKNLRKTIKYYEIISKKFGLPYIPSRVFKDKSGNINAVILQEGSIIPVVPERTSIDLLEAPGKFYFNVDKAIYEGNMKIDDRLRITMYSIYIQEAYERLRMELAKKLQGSNDRDKILSIIKDKSIGRTNQRNQLRSLLEKMCRKFTVVLSDLPFPIEKYVRPQLRRPCGLGKDKGKCMNNPHCYFSAGQCKLIILDKNPVNNTKIYPVYIERLVEELLRNPFLRDEILDDKLDEIINKSIEERNDEILVDGARDLMEQISTLYLPEKEYVLKDQVLFSRAKPDTKGFNKYLLSANELTSDDKNLLPLPAIWKDVFGQKVKYYDGNYKMDTLYYAVLRGLRTILPEIRTIKSLKNLEIQKIESLTNQNINKEPIFAQLNKRQNGVERILSIFKSFNKSVYKNINTMTELKEFIMSDEYPANIVDVYILSQALGINILLLDKRKNKKTNPKGFHEFQYSLKKDYLVLMEQQTNNKYQYFILEKNGEYVFKRKSLPMFSENKMKDII